MIIDHVGIVVPSIAPAAERWRVMFDYHQLTEVVCNTRQLVNVSFLAKDGSLTVKLIEPIGPSSPVYALARRGGGLHHLCFRAPSVDAEVARLAAMGMRILAEPQAGEAFEGEKIAFVYAGDGLNIELIDTDRRAGLLVPDGQPADLDPSGSQASRRGR